MSLRRRSRERDLDRELRAHLDLEAAELRADGLSAEESRYGALRAFGNVTFVQEEVRRMWTWSRFQIFAQDLRYAARSLAKSPGFAAAAILTLALGIGASTAVFTVVDTVLLKPLAFHESGRLVAAWESVRALSDDATGPNPRHVDIWQKRATAFSGLTYVRFTAMGLSLGTEHPRLTSAVLAVPNLFDVLQVHPLLGRGFIAGDGVQGQDNIAVLTYPLWQALFRGDPAAIGKTVRVGDVSRQIVGVLPPGFHFPTGAALRAFHHGSQPIGNALEPAIFVPAAVDLTQFAFNGNYGNWVTIGRLNPGVTMAQAAAQLHAIQAQLLQDPAYRGDRRPGALDAWLQPLQEAVVGESRSGLLLLLCAVIGLMLIACLNLANAQLGRALARNREAAVRTALGAGRGRLIWSALAENALLAAAGGGARHSARISGVGSVSPQLAGRAAAPFRSSTKRHRAGLLAISHRRRKRHFGTAARAASSRHRPASLVATKR